MSIKRQIKRNKRKKQQGFTLIEVLAGIIMSTIFVLITSQAIALSALFRVKAQRQAEATAWIQENLAEVKYQALLNLGSGDCDPGTGNTTQGYAQALINAVNSPASPASFATSEALLNKSYSMVRTLSVYDVEPYNLMRMSYSVVDPESGLEIANLYTEVIPDAALQCK